VSVCVDVDVYIELGVEAASESETTALSVAASEDIAEPSFMVVPTSRRPLNAEIDIGLTAKTSSSSSSCSWITVSSPSWLVTSTRGGLGGGEG
jgi:hypothetical protein